MLNNMDFIENSRTNIFNAVVLSETEGTNYMESVPKGDLQLHTVLAVSTKLNDHC